MTRAVSCAAAAWLALAVSARASFVGFFWIPGGESWAADVAGAPTTVGTNWVLDGTANEVASLMSTGGGTSATSVSLSVDAGDTGFLTLANTSLLPYDLEISWLAELDDSTDELSYLDGGIWQPIATGSNTQALYSGTRLLTLDPAEEFGWRLVSGNVSSQATAALYLRATSVPEPSAGLLLAAGLVAAALRRRRR